MIAITAIHKTRNLYNNKLMHVYIYIYACVDIETDGKENSVLFGNAIYSHNFYEGRLFVGDPI